MSLLSDLACILVPIGIAAAVGIVLGVFAMFTAGFKIVKQWERMMVLRWGKFRGFRKPGLNIIVPFIDQVIKIDLRTLSQDVPRQKTLTKDNIPVNVDAVIFYKVVDPEKAILNVKEYQHAIYLAAPPLLRNAIGVMTLDEVLQKRQQVADRIQEALAEMTQPWGIKVEQVEIKDIIVSSQLEDAISRAAAAERERAARTQLALAEKEIAATLVEAANTYEKDPIALQLRSMNMLYEMAMEGKATTIFIPTDTALQMRSPMGWYGTVDKLEPKGQNAPSGDKKA